jgi:hypothetical protein
MSTAAAWAAGAADYATHQHRIEGYRWSRLAWGTPYAQPVTIGFYVTSTYVPGQATFFIKNFAQDRCYYATFNVNATGVWEYKTITIPGDVAGTWVNDSGVGAYVNFTFACGASNLTAAPANTWSAAGGLALPGQTNFFISGAGGIVYITGLSIIPGSYGPSAAQALQAQRSFDQELPLCMRYYEKSFGYSTVPATGAGFWAKGTFFAYTSGAGGLGWFVPFLTKKRAFPTFTFFNPTAANALMRNNTRALDFTSTALHVQGDDGFTFSGTTPAGTAIGDVCGVNWTADARL